MQIFEQRKLRKVLRTLGTSATIIEAGVYDGTETNFIADCLAHEFAAYYAFEPDPRNVQRILETVLPYGVELIEAAIGREDGETTIHPSIDHADDATSSSTIRRPIRQRNQIEYLEPHTVKIRSLDSFAAERGIERVDFLFTDIEGAERDLIEGGRETLNRTQWWYTEQWDGVKHPLPYEGMWTKDQILAALPGWEVVHLLENDMLLRNTRCA